MKTSTFLTFVGDHCGKAREAIEFYTSIFPNSEIGNIIHYEVDEAGGTPELIKYGVFTINGTECMVSESNFNHAWGFTPGVSLFIQSEDESMIKSSFEAFVSNGGQVMVPFDHYETGDYGFGKKFGWCEDKYGVSWQFVLL